MRGLWAGLALWGMCTVGCAGDAKDRRVMRAAPSFVAADVLTGPRLAPGEAFADDTGVDRDVAWTWDAGSDGSVLVDPPPACSPTTELCNGVDDDCNGATDEGALCTDGGPCITTACAGGACTAQPHDGPCDDGNACTVDACADGVCLPSPSTAPCDDGNSCTLDDTCVDGACLGKALACDDGQVCTSDSCQPGLGCSHAAVGGACDDGDLCTTGDSCQAGLCVPGVSTCECNTDADCAGKNGGNLCLGVWQCGNHVCSLVVGSPVVCPVSSVCQSVVCEPASGQCVTSDVTIGSACSDGDACTVNDTCAQGACAGSPLNCDDGNACTADACDDKVGCLHDALSSACDDGDACTKSDTCQQGACVGSLLVCDDGNPCTEDTCTKGVCSTSWSAAEGKACTPALGCPGPGACKSAKCVPAAPCDGQESWPPTFTGKFAPAQSLWDPVGYHTIDIAVATSKWSQYLADVAAASANPPWYAADVTVDGLKYKNVGLRKFGYGSMVNNPQKPNIRIGFDHYSAKVFGPEGVKNLRLKSSGQDHTFLRQPLAQVMVQQAGGYAPRFSFARVRVNGEDYGLYQLGEQADKHMFQQLFGNNDGHKYQTSPTGACVGLNCEGKGCATTATEYEGDPGNGAELSALAAAATGSLSGWWAQAGKVANLKSLLAYYAVEAAVSDIDGLASSGQNFTVYGNLDTGLLEFIPTGQDLSWGNWGAWYGLHEPWGPPTGWCPTRLDEFYQRMMATPAVLAEVRAVWRQLVCGPMAAKPLKAIIDQYKALLTPDLYNDPKGIWSNAVIDADFAALRTYVGNRANLLLSEVGGCP